MTVLHRWLPVFPPMDDVQAHRLIRVLRVIAYLGIFVAAAFLITLYDHPFTEIQYPLVATHHLILLVALGCSVATLVLLPRGRLRLGGSVQIISLWLLLALAPDLLGVKLHVVAANHVALAICMGALLGWSGSLLLGLGSLIYLLVEQVQDALGQPGVPLLILTDDQQFILQISLYAMLLSLTVLMVFISQRRSEAGMLAVQALEVTSFSEKYLETIIESMADVLLVVAPDGSITKANRAAFNLLGYTESELHGQPLKTLLMDIPDQTSGVETMMRRQAMRHVSKRLRTKSGRALPVSLSSALLTDGYGKPSGVILVAQDMTELEAMRMQLHMTNVRYNQAITFSRIGVFEYDLESSEFFIDENTRKVLQDAGLGEITAFPQFLEKVVEEDHTTVMQAVEEYRAGEKSRLDVEFRIQTERGLRWLMVRGALMLGSGPRLIGTYMDVTRRKVAETELARRDEILRAVTASSEAFLRASDWEAHIPTLMRELGEAASVSRVYVFRHHPGPDGAMVWSQAYEWVAPGIVPQLDNPGLQNVPFEDIGFARWAEVMRRQQPVHGLVSAMPEAERALLESQNILSLAAMPVYVQDEWWGLIGFDDCLTAREWSESELDALQLAADSLGAAIYRRRVESNLQENRDFLQTIMTNLGQGVMVVDGSGAMIFVNPAYAALIGLAPEKLINHLPDEFVPEADRAVLDQNMIDRTGDRVTTFTSRIQHMDGTITDVMVTAVPRYVDGKLDGAYCVITDVTERHRLEEHRVELALEREQMRIMADFVRDASHDFRTPLSVIQTSLYLLRKQPEAAGMMERLNNIGTQANRLSRLIDGLLTMLELDKADLTLIPINLQTVAQNAVDRVRDKAHKAGLSLELQMPEEAVLVNGEEGYLMKAVSSLIDNAVAFTPAGGRVTVRVNYDDEDARLYVIDTGIGIAADEHQRIFERLYKVDKSRTIDSGGLGMGLSITKKIMELHGGEVTVESELNCGSTFMLRLTHVKQPLPRQQTRTAAASPITEDVKM